MTDEHLHRQHWDQKAADDVTAAKYAREYAESRDGMLRKLLNLESDAHLSKSAEANRLRTRIAEMDAESKAAEEAEWTREVTITRRGEWNTAVRNPKYTRAGVLLVSLIQSDLGYSFDGLKAAVARHGL